MKNILLIFGFCVCLLGCDDFTAVDLPNSQLTSGSVFEDRATANAAVVALYADLRDSGMLTGKVNGLSSQLGLYADEMDYYGVGSAIQFYNNSLLPSGSEINDLWNSGYSQIYAANSVIEGVGNSRSLETADKNQFTGEALFVRAIVHFYLVNLYGAVPFVATTDYNVNRTVRRMEEATVYGLIKADLEQAVALLPAEYVGAERVRPNKYAAQALLARVNLYRGDWAEAADTASAVLNQTSVYAMENNIDLVFLKESTATIWQFGPAQFGYNTDEAQSFVFFTGPPPSLALRNSLMAAFEAGDLRKSSWTKAVTDGTDTWYHVNKYREPLPVGASVEYSIVLRLSEQYLIRAEARAKQGELSGAKEDLNVVRHAAGLPDTDANTGTAIVTAVLAERQVEFFTEYGHRFFDLKRSNLLDSVLPLVKSGWDGTDRLLPIPQQELLRNPNLGVQNPGY